MLNHARQFLERVLPLPAAGQSSYLNIHWSSVTPEGKRFWDGRACSTIDECIKALEWVNKQGDKDIYVCMSSQARFEGKVSKKGNRYQRALRSQEDVVALKSLFIDVDVKEEAYPDTKTALEALKAFIGATQLPMPTAVVASGSGGFHVHWVLDEALPRSRWQQLADALARATREHGLLCDSQCTIDSARILRIPETVNLKGGEPKPVKLLSLGADVSVSAMSTVLAPYLGPASVTPSEAFPSALFPKVIGPKIAANDELGANLVINPVEIRIEEVAKSCGFIANTIASGGKDNPNPLWFLTAAASVFVEDGREALHMMSNRHGGYKPAETDDLYNRAVETKLRKNSGWPTCARFAGYGAKECQTCPLLKHGKSPLNFALKPVNGAPDATLPDKYIRAPDGIIMFRGSDEQGEPMQVPISTYPIFAGWLSDDPTWIFHFVTKARGNRKQTIDIPLGIITAKDGFNKYLGDKGLICTEKQFKSLKEFFVAWLQRLQDSKDGVVSAAPFGWSNSDGKLDGFAFAGRVWQDGGDRPAANPNPVLQFQYTPKGNDDAWRELSQIICEQDRPPLNAILAVAFAAPLVRFTGFPGLILNAYSSESGIGKTTAMKCSQAVWGHPVLAMQGLNDTTNSVLNKMGQTKSLPVYWDELKSEQQVKRFCSVVFDLTGGREKSRLNSDSTLKLSGTWQTILVSASNESLVDGMAREVGSTTAGLYRLFEYVVPPAVNGMSRDLGAVQRLVGRLDDNYGHAGLAYAKFLGTNWKRVEQEVAHIQDEINSDVNVKQDERMWTATMAVVLKGAQYANELGLTTINLQELRDFLVRVLADNRKEVAESPSDMTTDLSISGLLAEFLASTRSRNTLLTTRIWTSKGRPGKDAVKILSDLSKLGDIVVQIGQEDGLMRFSSTYFTRWCADRGHSRHTWTKKMEQEFGLKVVNGKLGGGTELVGAMEYLIELDMNHAKLGQLVE